MFGIMVSKKRNRRFNRYKYKFIRKYLFEHKLKYIVTHEHNDFLRRSKKMSRWKLLNSCEMTVLTIIFNYYDVIDKGYSSLVAFRMINEYRGNYIDINENLDLRSFVIETLYQERLRDGLDMNDLIMTNDNYFEFCVTKSEEFVRSLV